MAGPGAIKKIPDYMREKAGFMRYNPLIVDDTRNGLKTHYPDLYEVKDIASFLTIDKEGKSAIKIGNERIHRNQALRYMIWLYSKDSILNTKPQEALRDRKYKALDLAGFQLSPVSKKFTGKVIKDLVELRDAKFLRAVLAYLRDKQKNELWIEIIATEEQHFEAIQLRMTPVPKGNEGMKQADYKKKLSAICKELMVDIRQYWDEFWEDNLDLKQLGSEEIYLTIEDRARINTGS